MHQVGTEEIKGVLICDEPAFLQKVQGRGPRHRFVADQLNIRKAYRLESANLATSSDCWLSCSKLSAFESPVTGERCSRIRPSQMEGKIFSQEYLCVATSLPPGIIHVAGTRELGDI